MHYRFLVTVNKDKAESSKHARELVSETLLAEGFIGHEGRWGCGMADWFVIGGRWSGQLSRASWASELTQRMAAAEKEKGIQVWGTWYGDPEKQKIQQELHRTVQKIWNAEAPAAYVGIPVNRDTYQEYGYEDDAMILTAELYNALLKEYEGQCQSEHHADLEDEPISPTMVGSKWIVVVDYHN
jgi:hypothetical protein